jgi:hypothetical protein
MVYVILRSEGRGSLAVRSDFTQSHDTVTHWGINNQSFINGGTAPNGPNGYQHTASNQGKKPAFFLHDAWTEYRIIPTKLYVGARTPLLEWCESYVKSLYPQFYDTVDAPIFNWSKHRSY